MRDGSSCPECGDGVIKTGYVSKDFEYKGQTKTIHGVKSFCCDMCHECFTTPSLAKNYEETLISFFREVDKLLLPREIKEIRDKFKLTQKEFAAKLKVGEKNFSRYEAGIAPQGRSMDWLLRILREYPEAMTSVIDSSSQLSTPDRAHVFESKRLHSESRWVTPLFDEKRSCQVKTGTNG